MSRTFFFVGLALCAAGCMKPLEDQVKKDPNRGIIGKKTQDIGEFNPNAGAQVSDSKIHATDPVTAPVSAYGPMLERISKNEIAYALRLYEAENGQYPATYDEFMTKIIKANNIQLPVLPGGKKYQYDVENHQLVVVDAPEIPAPAAGVDGAPAADSPQ
jgi:hypothetical protein